MKHERSNIDYGGGSGSTFYSSDNFRVVHWKLSNGERTTIESKLHQYFEIDIDGLHEFNNDDECLEQLNFDEIFKAIENQRSVYFKLGEESKIKEIRKCLTY